MRLAWFTPADTGGAEDGFEVGGLVAELGSDCEVTVFDAARAHDFPWLQARHPFSLCIYELDDSPQHDYIWAYVAHYPGLLRIPGDPSKVWRRTLRLRDQRAAAGAPHSTTDPLGSLCVGSRVVVVSDEALASSLADRYPGSRVRSVPVGVRSIEPTPRAGASVVVGATAPSRLDTVRRAMARAQALGAQLEFAVAQTPEAATRHSDVIVALEWPPPPGVPRAAALGMAAGRAVIVLEAESVAGLPCLDPQTWTARGFGPQPPPVVISLDPRDEEHSLVLALTRLAADADLRARLGVAAKRWWHEHADIAAAARQWRRIIDEAVVTPQGIRSGRLGGAADGSERARAILREIGASVDFLL